MIRLLDPAAPRWVVAGRFFDRPRYRDGAELHYAATSNVLIARSVLGIATPPFNERLGLAGGEDTYFFRMAYLAGCRIVWADRAVVRESVPLSRCTARWLLRREYRRGNTLSIRRYFPFRNDDRLRGTDRSRLDELRLFRRLDLIQ